MHQTKFSDTGLASGKGLFFLKDPIKMFRSAIGEKLATAQQLSNSVMSVSQYSLLIGC